MPFDQSSRLCALLLLSAATLFGVQQTRFEAQGLRWPVLPELTWQGWVTSVACTANDDLACALAVEP